MKKIIPAIAFACMILPTWAAANDHSPKHDSIWDQGNRSKASAVETGARNKQKEDIWDQGNRSKASVVDAGARNKQKADIWDQGNRKKEGIWDQGNRKKENIFSQGNGARPKQNNTIHGIQRKAHDSEMSEINNVR